MEELNERKYTTEELKEYARKMKERKKLDIESIPGYKKLSPEGLKYRLKYDIGRYNDTVEKHNELRKKMLEGRISDEENAKAIQRLKSLHNKADKIYKNNIASMAKQGRGAEKEEEIGAMRKKAEKEEKEDTFKDKVRKYSEKMKKKYS